jgi:hypothetical protein
VANIYACLRQRTFLILESGKGGINCVVLHICEIAFLMSYSEIVFFDWKRVRTRDLIRVKLPTTTHFFDNSKVGKVVSLCRFAYL